MKRLVFSSLLFLFLYLPVVLLIYYVTPLRWRNGVLLVFNLIFYGWGEPVYIVIMFLSTAIDYTHGMLVERYKRRDDDRGARLAVCSSVVFNLALLFFFKYWDFVAGSLAAIGLPLMPILGLSLPIGISFYTFQTMSYTIDVYRGDAPVQRNLINFGTFVTLFPQLIAGPIIKYKAGQQSGAALGRLQGSARRGAHHGGRLAGRDRLLPADLLRFLRLLRHGRGPGQDAGL